MVHSSDVAILCHTCNARLFLWEAFHFFFDKYCEVDGLVLYMSSENGNASCDSKFIDIETGPGEWSDRLRIALDNMPHDRVMVLCEDYFLCEPFEQDLWDKMVSRHWEEENSTDAVRWRNDSPYYSFLKGTNQYHPKSKYLLSMEATVWRKDFLLSRLIRNESVWDFEYKGTRRLHRSGIEPVIFLERWEGYENAFHKGKLSDKAREMIRNAPETTNISLWY